MDQHHSHYVHHHHHSHHDHNNDDNNTNHTRYAPPPPHHNHSHLPPPPPPPPSLPTPPAPPPQAQPLRYRTIRTPPPPPPYAPNNNHPPSHQNQFPQFNSPNYPNRPFQEEHPISNNHNQPFSQSPRIASRILPGDPFPRRNFPRFDTETRWDPNPGRRIAPDCLLPRNYTPVDLDSELRQHREGVSLPPSAYPAEKIRYDPDRSRWRLEYEYEGNPRKDEEFGCGSGNDANYHNYHRRGVGDLPPRHDLPNGGFGRAPPAMSREINIDLKPGGYVRGYSVEFEDKIPRVGRRDGHGEGKRWLNERRGPKELPDSRFELGTGEIGFAKNVDDDFRVGTREEYGWESGRYSGRGNNREFGHELWRPSLKKQVQKKSALLRIQNAKPSYRNREIEQLRNAGYSAESNTNDFRGKEQCGHVGHGMKQEEREGSPVELDISFESNSLVAKAIVTASTSTVVTDTNMNSVSDADLTPSEKRKKVSVSDSDCSGLEAAKVSRDVVTLNSSSCKVNDCSGSVNDLSLQNNVVNPCSQPCTRETDSVKNEVAGGSTKIHSGKSSPRVVKKKKVVKRVVKKVVGNPKSTMSNSRSVNKVHGCVQPDRVIPSSSSVSVPNKVEPCLEQKNITVDKMSMPGHSSYNLSKDRNQLLEDRNGDLTLLSLGPHSRSRECETDEDSDTQKGAARFESGLNIPNSQSCASTGEAKKIDSECLDANNSVHDLRRMPDTNMVPELLNGSTSKINDVGCDIKQLCQNQESQSCENYSNVRCPQNGFVIDVVDDSVLSSADNIGKSDHTNTYNSASSVYGLISGDLKGSKEKLTVTECGLTGESGFGLMVPTIITKYAILEENPDVINPASSSAMSAPSNSGKIKIHSGTDCIQNAIAVTQGSYSGLVNLEDGTAGQCSDITNDAVKDVSPSYAAISSENCGKEEPFSSSNLSVGFGEGDINNMKKRKARTHSKFLHSKMEGISPKPVNSVSHANDWDTASSVKVKDACCSEVLDQSVQSLGSNLESCLNGIITLHGKKELSEAELCVRDNEIDDANYLSLLSKGIKVTTTSELSDAVVVSKSCADFPVSFSDKQAPEKEVALSSMDVLFSAQSLSCSEDSRKLSDNFVGGSCDARYANNETMSSDHFELKNSDFASYSLREDLDIQFPLLDGECKENGTQMQTDILASGYNKGDMKDSLIHQQSIVSHPSDGDLEEDAPEAPSDVCSQGISEAPERGNLNCTSIQDENNCGDISAVEHGSDLPTCTSPIQHTNKIMKSANATGHSNPVERNLMRQSSQVNSKVSNNGPVSYFSENGSKNTLGGAMPKTQKGRSFIISKSNTKTSASSTHLSNPRTWRRSGNNSQGSLPGNKLSPGKFLPKRQILDRKGNFQNTSYIRKGNSLVRQPTTVSFTQISSVNKSPLSLDELSKSTRSGSRIDVSDQLTLKTGVAEVPQQSQRKPSLSIGTLSEENISSPLVEPPSSGCCENASDPRKLIDINDTPNSSKDDSNQYETPDNQSSPLSKLENQVEANDGHISSFSTRRIVYTKPKTNQLVATSNSRDEKSQTAFSEGYYKRCKNQLVRNMNQTVAVPNATLDSDAQGSCKVLCNRKFSKRQLHKVAGRSFKSLRASLVWTLCGKKSPKNGHNSWHSQKVLPQLFPWKRPTYLRSVVHNSASCSNSSFLSAIRKMDTVYTRSTRGFSLWKSKVLSVGGSSLKWSKSIEKNSKQANEEATLAVAAVERKKREQKGAACVGSHANKRIFRIGSVRYKMDPSRRTLQRISDDESLSSATADSGLVVKRAYIPRRLVIGNDEYVRIGNGNQLIRDPKKRTRKLANEKVRWSLHTARQRLARKQKYCQFFTRFGKCNKEGGKCPYVHDPSKIAVCTKFLNGLCSTPSCKLTHKVIPERMPDCSYFLQGLCTNRNCPYRHVNVNPKASVCEGFLKGYCADGNECRKKHSCICPTFQATGTCTKGTRCKLHHPEKQKGKKRKRSGDQSNSNSRGRYFASVPINVSEAGIVVIPGQRDLSDDLEGELTDYISLQDDYTKTVGQSLALTLCDSDSLSLQLEDYEVNIKPTLLMKTKGTPRSSWSSVLQS